MNRKKLYIRTDRSSVAMFLATCGILSILLSELSFYMEITSVNSLVGIKETLVYTLILFSGFLAWTRGHRPMEIIIQLGLLFTVLTCISTVLGVTPDISIWRQCVHLTFFAACLVTFYIGTERIGAENCTKYITASYIIVVAVYLYGTAFRHSISGNTVYYMLLFLPATAFIRTSFLRRLLYVLQFFAVVISNKRTALISVVLYFLLYEFLTNRTQSRRKKIYKIFAYILVAIIVYFIYPIVIQKLGITVFKEISFANIREDGGSNRLFIYAQLWAAQLKGNLSHWLIGSGYNSVLLSRICTDGIGGGWVSAHDDFLEVLYDYGVVGLTVYMTFLICLIKRAISMIRDEYRYAIPFMCSIIMILSISFTSHLVIYLNYYSVIFAFWAICLADYRFHMTPSSKRGGL